MNYEKDIYIDENALDVEWLEQANLAWRYGKHYANLKKEVALLEEKIKVLRSELIKEANEDPENTCNKSKPNAADIEAYFRSHQEHKKLKQEWIEAEYEMNVAESVKNEISFARRAALENLVVLHGQGYFAGPRMPRDLSEERKKKQDKVNTGIANKMRRKK